MYTHIRTCKHTNTSVQPCTVLTETLSNIARNFTSRFFPICRMHLWGDLPLISHKNLILEKVRLLFDEYEINYISRTFQEPWILVSCCSKVNGSRTASSGWDSTDSKKKTSWTLWGITSWRTPDRKTRAGHSVDQKDWVTKVKWDFL